MNDLALMHYALNKAVLEYRDLHKYVLALEAILYRAPLPAEFLVEFEAAKLERANAATRRSNEE